MVYFVVVAFIFFISIVVFSSLFLRPGSVNVSCTSRSDDGSRRIQFSGVKTNP